MRKIWSVARYEYLRHVRRRGFLFAAFGVPLLSVALIGVVALVASGRRSEQRLGIVDPGGQLKAVDPPTLKLEHVIPIQEFAGEAQARRAFESGAIDVYAVISDDYLQNGKVRATGKRRLSERAEDQLEAMLQESLLAAAPDANRERLDEPDVLFLRTLEGGREVDAQNVLLFLLPYVFALVFMVTTFTTSGYLLQAVAEEKEDRVGEILAVTVAPRQMMAGKILGLSGVGLTQVLIWLALGTLAVLSLFRDLSWFAELQLPWPLLGLALLYFVLGYLLIAACYGAAGAAVATPQEAQSLVMPISLLALAPFFVVTVILARPSGVLAVIFSLVPFSAPMTMLMRLPLADVPAWQIAAGLFGLIATTVGAVLLSGRVLRLGMLRYGKRLSIREVFAAEA